MKYIENLRDKFKGDDIWVSGSGTSLDDYSEDFLDDKISICVNTSIYAFNICTLSLHGLGDTLVINGPELYKKSIIVASPRDVCDNPWTIEDIVTRNIIESEYRDDPSIMKCDPYLSFEAFPEIISNIIENKPTLYGNNATLTSFAVQAAVIMGAKKIFLIGCDAERDGIKSYSDRARPRVTPTTPLKRYLVLDDAAVDRIDKLYTTYKIEMSCWAKALKVYGIDLVKYYPKPRWNYNKGENKLV